MRTTLAALTVIALAVAHPAPAQDLASFEKKVTRQDARQRPHLLVCERPEAPVFSFFTHVDVGGAARCPASPASPTCSSTWRSRAPTASAPPTTPTEKAALEAVEAAYAAYDARAPQERRARRQEGRRAREGLEGRASPRPTRYVVKNEFGEIIDREGGVGLNAFTNSDETGYFFSLPRQQARALGLPRVGALPASRCSASSTRSATSS